MLSGRLSYEGKCIKHGTMTLIHLKKDSCGTVFFMMVVGLGLLCIQHIMYVEGND